MKLIYETIEYNLTSVKFYFSFYSFRVLFLNSTLIPGSF